MKLSDNENTEMAFIKDFLDFGINLRKNMFLSIYEYYNKCNSDADKNLSFLNAFIVLGMSYEDLSAYCLFLSEYCNKISSQLLLERLLQYYPGEAKLNQLIGKKTKKEVSSLLGLSTNTYTSIGLTKYETKRAINGFIKSLNIAAKEQDRRLPFYNKLKHGGIVLSDVSAFFPGKSNTKKGPCVLLYDKNTNHFHPKGAIHEKREMRKIYNHIESNQRLIGELLLIYLVNRYKSVISKIFTEEKYHSLREMADSNL